jgi:hypothetical protein
MQTGRAVPVSQRKEARNLVKLAWNGKTGQTGAPNLLIFQGFSKAAATASPGKKAGGNYGMPDEFNSPANLAGSEGFIERKKSPTINFQAELSGSRSTVEPGDCLKLSRVPALRPPKKADFEIPARLKRRPKTATANCRFSAKNACRRLFPRPLPQHFSGFYREMGRNVKFWVCQKYLGSGQIAVLDPLNPALIPGIDPVLPEAVSNDGTSFAPIAKTSPASHLFSLPGKARKIGEGQNCTEKPKRKKQTQGQFPNPALLNAQKAMRFDLMAKSRGPCPDLMAQKTNPPATDTPTPDRVMMKSPRSHIGREAVSPLSVNDRTSPSGSGRKLREGSRRIGFRPKATWQIANARGERESIRLSLCCLQGGKSSRPVFPPKFPVPAKGARLTVSCRAITPKNAALNAFSPLKSGTCGKQNYILFLSALPGPAQYQASQKPAPKAPREPGQRRKSEAATKVFLTGNRQV